MTSQDLSFIELKKLQKQKSSLHEAINLLKESTPMLRFISGYRIIADLKCLLSTLDHIETVINRASANSTNN